MKRCILLLLVVSTLLSMALTGCQNQPATPTQDTLPAEGQEEKKPLLQTKRGPVFDIADNTERQGFPENDPYIAEDSSASGGEYCYTQIPNVLYDPDTDLVYVNYTRHRDIAVDYPYDSTKVYELETLRNATLKQQLQGEYVDMVTENTMFFAAMAKLSDGSIFCQNYMTYYLTDTTATTYSWIVDDQGNWQRVEGLLTIPAELAAKGPQPNANWHRYAFSRCLIELDDGTLLGSMYGTYGAILVESKDRGKTWNYRSTIAMSAIGLEEPYINTDGTNITWFEPAVARCADGSLLCVMRTWRDKPLWQTRSMDDGLTWSEPTLMPGKQGMSIYPQLVLLSNGVLAMATGDPDDTLYLSLDGCGYHWNEMITTYADETTGNCGITEVGYDEETDTVTLLVVGDKNFNNKSLSGIWGRTVTITRNQRSNPQLNKVVIRTDKTMLRPGDTLQAWVDAVLDTNSELIRDGYSVTWESLMPERAAVDENGLITGVGVGTAQVRAVVTYGDKTVLSNTLTIKVHDDNVLEEMELNATKWVLKQGEEGNIVQTVYNSFGKEMDAGLVNWKFESWDPEILQVDEKTGHYLALKPGVVDVLVRADKDGVYLSKRITMIVESDQWVEESFEAESFPKNCVVTNLVTISTNRSYSGSRAACINDSSTTLAPSLCLKMPESKGVIVEFMLYTENTEHSSTFGVGKTKGNGKYDYTCNTARVGLLYNAFTGNQGFQAYDGKAWSRNNRNNVIPHQQWNKIRLEVTSDKPYNLYVNDKLIATLPVATVNDALNAIYFSSGGTPSVGDVYYIDDLRYMVFQ